MDSTVFSVSLRPEHGELGLCLKEEEKREKNKKKCKRKSFQKKHRGNEVNKVPK